MNAHVQSIVRRKISDFIRLEEGRIGNRTAFTVSALVGASALGAMLFGPAAEAHHACGGIPGGNDCPQGTKCCYITVGDHYHCCTDAQCTAQAC